MFASGERVRPPRQYIGMEGEPPDDDTNDDTASSRGRPQRVGDLAGIDLLLTAPASGGSSSTAGATTHQKAPRRKNRFSRFRSLISRPRIALPVAVIVVAAASAGAWAVTRSTASTAPSYRVVPAITTTM